MKLCIFEGLMGEDVSGLGAMWGRMVSVFFTQGCAFTKKPAWDIAQAGPACFYGRVKLPSALQGP